MATGKYFADFLTLDPLWLKYLPHPVIPNQNLNNLDLNVENPLYQPSKWNSTNPFPKYIPSKLYPETDEGIVWDLVKEKSSFLYELKKIRMRHGKSTTGTLYNRNGDIVCKRYIGKFIEFLENDPDPYFSGYYNWYFTGGNLKICDEQLFHVEGKHMEQLKISNFTGSSTEDLKIIPLQDSLWNKNIESVTKNGIIYEIICGYDDDDDNETNVYIRQKHTISAPSNSEHVIEMSSEIPFISGTCIPETNKFATIDVQRTIKLWSNGNRILSQGKVNRNQSIDNWSCIRQYKNYIIFYVNRHSIRLYDLRNRIGKKAQVFEYNLKNYLGPCEYISCIEHVPESNLVYVGTTHNLFAIDTRSCRGNNLKLLKWTHQLNLPPNMLKISKSDEGEIVAIGSSFNGDVKIIETARITKENRLSFSLPYKPRSLCDSIEYIKSHGNGIQPISYVKHYAALANVGIQIYRPNVQKFDFHLLTQNSAGCIISQFVSKSKIENSFDQRAIKTMENWNSTVKSSTNPEFYAINITNFRSLTNVLKFDMSSLNEREEDTMPSRDRPHWKKPIEELAMFKDILASDLMKTWEFDADITFLQNMSHAPMEEVVSSWLQAATDSQLPRALSPDLFSSQQTNVLSQEQSRSQKIKKKTKPKHVPGF